MLKTLDSIDFLKIYNEECDSNLFIKIENGEFEKIKETPYLKYLVANYFKDFFKNAINILDLNNDFMHIRYEEDVTKEDFLKAKEEYYNRNIESFEKFKKEKENFYNEHKDYYRIQPCLPPSSNYNFLFDYLNNNFNTIIENLTLENCIQGYKASNEILKSIDNKDLDKYCTEAKPMLNYEHRDEYNNFIDSLYKKYNLLTDSEIKESCPKNRIKKTRLSLNRSKCEDFSIFNNILSFINI